MEDGCQEILGNADQRPIPVGVGFRPVKEREEKSNDSDGLRF